MRGGLLGEPKFFEEYERYVHGHFHAPLFEAKIQKHCEAKSMNEYFIKLAKSQTLNKQPYTEVVKQLSSTKRSETIELVNRLVQMFGLTQRKAAKLTGLEHVIRSGRLPSNSEAFRLSAFLEYPWFRFLGLLDSSDPWYHHTNEFHLSKKISANDRFNYGRISIGPIPGGVVFVNSGDYLLLSLTVNGEPPISPSYVPPSWHAFLQDFRERLGLSPSAIYITSRPFFSDKYHIHQLLWPLNFAPWTRMALYSRLFASRTTQITIGSFVSLHPIADRFQILKQLGDLDASNAATNR